MGIQPYLMEVQSHNAGFHYIEWNKPQPGQSIYIITATCNLLIVASCPGKAGCHILLFPRGTGSFFKVSKVKRVWVAFWLHDIICVSQCCATPEDTLAGKTN